MRLARHTLLLIVAGVLLAACGSTPMKQMKALHEVIYQFDGRTGRLCTGASPALPKAICLDRLSVSAEAQLALDAAQEAFAGCAVGAECPAGEIALRAAEAYLPRLENYVYGGN